jgi:hypothetical protein
MDQCIVKAASGSYNAKVITPSGYCFQGDDKVKGLPKNSSGNVNEVCVPDNNYPNNRCVSGWRVDQDISEGRGICCGMNGALPPPGCMKPLPSGYQSSPVVKYTSGEQSFGYIPPGAEVSNNYPGYAFPTTPPKKRAPVVRRTRPPPPKRPVKKSKFGSTSTNWLMGGILALVIVGLVVFYMKKRKVTLTNGVVQFGRTLKRSIKF